MMLNQWKRGLSAAAALALALTLALPASAADPLASGGFAEVLISAQETDIPEEALQLALYREVQDLVMRGVCSVEDADKALVYGPGLRWAIFGHKQVIQIDKKRACIKQF